MKSLGLIHFNHSITDGLVSWIKPGTNSSSPNYGDMLVCASLLRQTNSLQDNVRVVFGKKISKPVEAAILRGSTYLHNNFDFEKAITTIDSIDSTIATVGLGAQNPNNDIRFLDKNKSAERFLKKLAEKSKSISVRGGFTASILERLGITNLRVTGCPSMFYSLTTPKIRINESLYTSQRKIGLSLHPGLRKSIFCRSPKLTRQKHAEIIKFSIENCFSLKLFEQGSPREYNISRKDIPLDQRIESAIEFINLIGAEKILSPTDIIDRMVNLGNIEEWRKEVAVLDALVGFRFHGNMIGLSQGIPCYYYTYDSRLEEFCKLYKLPYSPIENKFNNPFDEILTHDWSMSSKAIKNCFNELVAFYEENGIDHTLNS